MEQRFKFGEGWKNLETLNLQNLGFSWNSGLGISETYKIYSRIPEILNFPNLIETFSSCTVVEIGIKAPTF